MVGLFELIPSSATASLGAVLGLAGLTAWQWRSRGLKIFDVLYTIYCSPLGQFIHDKTVAAAAKNRQAMGDLQAHTDCLGKDDDQEWPGIVELGDDVCVLLVPLLSDNYAFLLVDKKSGEVATVDPCDAAQVLDALARLEAWIKLEPGVKLVLSTVLTTHYHFDHDGGNKLLVKSLPHRIRVFGGVGERMQGVSMATDLVKGGDIIRLGQIDIHVIDTPGHTRGHITFYIPGSEKRRPAAFTGDALFHGGCGRFFECGPEVVINSLACFCKLPDDCLVFCGHEYSRENLEFAAWIEPGNGTLIERLKYCRERREQKLPTIPSTISQERQVNPFVRIAQLAVVGVRFHFTSEVELETLRALAREAWSRWHEANPGDSTSPLVSSNSIGDSDLIGALGKLRQLKDANAHK